MRPPAILPLALAALLGACGGGASAAPAASIPPAPQPPERWTTMASVGTTAGPGFTGVEVDARPGPVAVAVVCTGTGSLVVTVGGPRATGGAPVPAWVVPCDPSGAQTRLELDPSPGGRLTVDAAVLEGAGALSASAFAIAVEQPTAP